MGFRKGFTFKKYRYYQGHRNWRAANIARGLTCDGKPRKKAVYYRYPKLAKLPPKTRAAERTRIWLQRERYGKGLTYRGTARKPRRLPALEQAWRELRATMEIVRPAETILERDE